MTLFYVISLCILLILPKGSTADCGSPCTDPQVCDSDDTCKIKHGSHCTASADCVKGAQCDTASTNCQCGGGYAVISDLCKIDVGGSCAGTNSTMCKTGLQCEADKCKIDVGGSCAGTNSTMCKTGLQCEADKCKIKHGGSPCATSADCVKGAECDTTSHNCQCGGGYIVISDLCKIDVGGSCAGTNSSMCKTGLQCEADKCILKAGQTGCTNDNQCIANSVCSTGTPRTCTCSANYIQQTSGLCSGVAGLTCSMFLLGIVLLVSKYFQ